MCIKSSRFWAPLLLPNRGNQPPKRGQNKATKALSQIFTRNQWDAVLKLLPSRGEIGGRLALG